MLALTLGALFPLADVLAGIATSRSVGIVAAISLAGILAGLGLAFVTGNALFAILKDSAFSLLFGLFFLGSLATPRPLIFRLNRQMLDASGAEALDRAWDERAGVRRVFRVMTIVWGAGLVVEALARVAFSLTLPIATAAAASPWIALICIGGLILWTVLHVRARRRAAERAGLSPL